MAHKGLAKDCRSLQIRRLRLPSVPFLPSSRIRSDQFDLLSRLDTLIIEGCLRVNMEIQLSLPGKKMVHILRQDLLTILGGRAVDLAKTFGFCTGGLD